MLVAVLAQRREFPKGLLSQGCHVHSVGIPNVGRQGSLPRWRLPFLLLILRWSSLPRTRLWSVDTCLMSELLFPPLRGLLPLGMVSPSLYNTKYSSLRWWSLSDRKRTVLLGTMKSPSIPTYRDTGYFVYGTPSTF